VEGIGVSKAFTEGEREAKSPWERRGDKSGSAEVVEGRR
jgi:hypothetical protein